METDCNSVGVAKRTVPVTPECLSWTVDEVADWVERIGYPLHKEIFRRNFINGPKLVVIQTSSLPRMGIMMFEDIVAITKKIRQLLGTD